MGIKSHKTKPHWNYVLAIERDLDELSRYVEFTEKNFACYSIEIARILLASGAETDVVCRQLCLANNPVSTAGSINDYRDELKSLFPDISQFEVLIPRFGLTLRPWDEWNKKDGVPFWWTAYNKTKHERDSHYEEANLKNALNAVAGLFIVVLYLYRAEARQGELLPSPQMLRPDDIHFGGTTFDRFEFGFNYNL